MLAPPPVNLVRERVGREGDGGGGFLTRRRRDNLGRAALFKVKASFAFEKRRRRCLLRDAIGPTGVSLNVSGQRALMKLIEQPVIDNGTARQRRRRGPRGVHRGLFRDAIASHASSI